MSHSTRQPSHTARGAGPRRLSLFPQPASYDPIRDRRSPLARARKPRDETTVMRSTVMRSEAALESLLYRRLKRPPPAMAAGINPRPLQRIPEAMTRAIDTCPRRRRLLGLALHQEYERATIPGGTYPVNLRDVTTFGARAVVVTTTRMPDTVAYEITRVVFDNFDDFRQLHPAFEALSVAEMVRTTGHAAGPRRSRALLSRRRVAAVMLRHPSATGLVPAGRKYE
jgi:hypothetical protein